MKRKVYYWVFASAVALVFTGTAIGAQKRPTTVAEIALYRGADRKQILEEGAKKEGKLLYYTTSGEKGELRPFMDLFKKKYPYIKLEKWKGNSRQVAARIFEEYQAGRHVVDAVEATQVGHLTFRKLGILQPFYSPGLAHMEEAGITSAPGGGALSVVYRFHGIGFGYNTKLMTKEEAPKNYQDLLDPKWKGKMALPGGGVGVNFMGALLKTHGEEFVKKVAQQNFTIHTMSARALFDLVIAGEYPGSPSILSSHVGQNKQKGAPVDWLPLEPVALNMGAVALPKYSSHPHAAMLLLDLRFSKEVAEIQKAYFLVPTHKDFASESPYTKIFGAESMAEGMKWQKMYNTLFLKR
ncbi:ABC transporter substrate-binding protein [Thermodesulfobacteriota bacterium]